MASTLNRDIILTRDSVEELELRTLEAVIGMEDFKTYLGSERLRCLVALFTRYLAREAYESSPEGQYGIVGSGGAAERLTASFQVLVRSLNSTSLDLFLKSIFGYPHLISLAIAGTHPT